MIFFDPTGTAKGLEQCLNDGTNHQGATGLLVLSCDENTSTPSELNPVLRQTKLPIVGGIFPRIIYNNELHETGNLVIALSGVISIETVTNLSDPEIDYEHALEQKRPNSDDIGTLILFVDGFATRNSTFIESLFNIFGLDFNYVGGGSGSTSLIRKPNILTNQGVLEDTAILAFLKTRSSIGVTHGWEELSGPYQVTGSGPSRVSTIEWESAYEFYRKTLEETAGVQVGMEDFYEVAKHYPFGIARLSGEQIVRDPYLVTPDGSLQCVGDIDEGAFISILQGNPESLITAARDSLHRSLVHFGDERTISFCFFVDCISRIAVLGEDFQQEIDAVNRPDLPLVGICSVGEIANSGAEYLELYNKTSVMAVLATD